MRAPHLTNLHEDLQLSGKIYYSLLHCLEDTGDGGLGEMHIGRHDGEPKPQILLRGVGIQKNHARIIVNKASGMFELHCSDAAYE